MEDIMDKNDDKNYNMDVEELLIEAGVRPTSNRILVAREIMKTHYPLSMTEIETNLESLEKSSVFRVLTLLLKKGVIHALEDGRGIVRYEMCGRSEGHRDEDMHVHFYCMECHHVYCFEDMPAPQVCTPDGFDVKSVNYMLKGICPKCRK